MIEETTPLSREEYAQLLKMQLLPLQQEIESVKISQTENYKEILAEIASSKQILASLPANIKQIETLLGDWQQELLEALKQKKQQSELPELLRKFNENLEIFMLEIRAHKASYNDSAQKLIGSVQKLNEFVEKRKPEPILENS